MTLLRRTFVPFVILFDILGFGLIFVIVSNTANQGTLVYMAKSDAVFASVLSLAGFVANVVLALVLARGNLEARRREAGRTPESRGRITGE